MEFIFSDRGDNYISIDLANLFKLTIQINVKIMVFSVSLCGES